MNMARSTFYKRPNAEHAGGREKADADLRVRIEDILAEFPSYGYRRITHELRETRPAGQSQASLTCHAGARTHAPPRTRMARHDEQQAQAARLSEPEMFDHSGGA